MFMGNLIFQLHRVLVSAGYLPSGVYFKLPGGCAEFFLSGVVWALVVWSLVGTLPIGVFLYYFLLKMGGEGQFRFLRALEVGGFWFLRDYLNAGSSLLY